MSNEVEAKAINIVKEFYLKAGSSPLAQTRLVVGEPSPCQPSTLTLSDASAPIYMEKWDEGPNHCSSTVRQGLRGCQSP